jgi:glycosyltransferase involved in cell wall biosynthesis
MSAYLIPFVSVIVPVYNGEESLLKLIAALKSQTYPQDYFEVLVVDNHREPHLKNLPDWVHVYHEPRPGSYSARNKGIQHARGEILAFTDADCIPCLDWLKIGVQALKKHPHIGLVAGGIRMILSNPNNPPILEIYDTLISLTQKSFLEQKKFAATANSFTYRVLFEELGFFDSSRFSGADADWGYRVYKSGRGQIYCEEAYVEHPTRKTLKELLTRSLRVTAGSDKLQAEIDAGLRGFKKWKHHFLDRPKNLWKQLMEWLPPLSTYKILGVLILYFGIKILQVLEKLRVRLGGQAVRK